MRGRSQGSGQGTRGAIVRAAMLGIAEKGFEATSIREIAAMAGTNVASISYHFGGKDGLRAACAEHVVRLLGGVLAAAPPGDAPPDDPEAAARLLAALVRTMTGFLLLKPEGRLVVGFMLRELGHPSSALDTVYEGLIAGIHARICGVWGAATGQPADSEAVRLAVFATVGQIIYFHVGRPVVERRLGWSGIGEPEAGAIADTIVRNLEARLRADRELRP